MIIKMLQIIAAGCFINQGKKILIVTEKNALFREKRNFPMGQLNEGEYIPSCAIRETLEETGFHVKLSSLLGIYQEIISIGSVTAFIFEAEIVEGKLTIEDDLLNVEWLTVDEIKELDKKGLLVSPYILSVIDRWSSEKRTPILPEFIKFIR